MTDHPKWMPSESEIREACAAASWGERSKIRALIRTAVEKALAERRVDATDGNLRFFIERTSPAALDALPQFGRREFEEIHKYLAALAEQEARHKREVIEAKIESLRPVAEYRSGLYVVDADALARVAANSVKTLRAELAALEVKP